MKIKDKDGKEFNIKFSDSFFESFDGTDEELKEFMDHILNSIKDGSFFEEAEPISEEELSEEEANRLMDAISKINRTIQ